MLLPVIFAQKLFEKSLRDGNNFTFQTFFQDGSPSRIDSLKASDFPRAMLRDFQSVDLKCFASKTICPT